MAAPLLDVAHVVGSFDADLGGWEARDRTPGPAGTAGLELAAGVELEVDVASPSTLVGLWAPSPLPRRGAAALARLLGDERAAALLRLGAGGGPPGPAVLGPDGPRRLGTPRRRWPDDDEPGAAWRSGRPGGGVHPALARAALAMATEIAGPSDPLVRALGHVDAAVARLGLGGGLGLGRAGRAHAFAGAELLLDLARRGELDGRLVDGSGLAAALDRLVPVLPDAIGAAARALRSDVLAGAVTFSPVPDEASPGAVAGGAAPRARTAERHALEADAVAFQAPPAAAPAPMGERAVAPRPRPVGLVVPVDHDGLPLALVGAPLQARTTTPSEAELRFPGLAAEADRWWARAFGTDGRVVAAAPLLADGPDLLARLLVPPDQLARVRVDVTDQPGEPRPSPDSLGVLEAVRLGQAAARAGRLGDAAAASARWHRSAAAWDAAGAQQRAGLARELGRAPGRERVPPPLLADPSVEDGFPGA